jgi:hypothetical protein
MAATSDVYCLNILKSCKNKDFFSFLDVALDHITYLWLNRFCDTEIMHFKEFRKDVFGNVGLIRSEVSAIRF